MSQSEIKTVDARGLSCPQPALLAQKVLKEAEKGTVHVLVETVTSRENVSRLARQRGWQVEVKEQGKEFLLVLVKEG